MLYVDRCYLCVVLLVVSLLLLFCVVRGVCVWCVVFVVLRCWCLFVFRCCCVFVVCCVLNVAYYLCVVCYLFFVVSHPL